MADNPDSDNRRFVRSAIKKDLLYFAFPALLVWTTELVFCVGNGFDGWRDFASTVEDIVRRPRSLSVQVWVGFALIVIGFVILFVAHLTIGRFHVSTVAIRKDHQLITHGIYRFTRHPIYLGVLIVAVGIPVYSSSLGGLVIMSALIPIFLNRIQMEERLLIEEFGDAYRGYRETTRKLIPFIY
jgi:protein-S-isoprenylcysteine O-methyltransferase Ste14